jgi:hypothetical protein
MVSIGRRLGDSHSYCGCDEGKIFSDTIENRNLSINKKQYVGGEE